ncbi:MAG: DUF748 domain-containing protein [Thermodesulfobacteriota bacterium]
MEKPIKGFAVRVLKSKAVIIAAAVIAVYTLTGFFLVPYLIGHFAPKVLSEQLKSEVSLQQVKINPYSLTLEAGEFRINEPSGTPIVGFDRVHVNFQLSSLFRWALTFKDVILDNPSLNIVIDSDGNLNLARLVASESSTKTSAAAEEDKSPLRMLLYNIEINEGSIEVTDTRQVIPAKASFHPLTIHLSDISTLPEREGDYSLTATGGDGTVLNWSGQVALHPLRSEGELAFRHIPMETPWTFFRSLLNILPPEGELNLETRYLVDLGKDTTVAVLDDLSVRVMSLGLQLEEAEETFLRLPELAMDAERVDVVQRRIDTLSLAVPGGGLDLISNRDGVLNLQQVVRDRNDETTPAPLESPGDPEEPWIIDISGVSLEGIALRLRDESMSPARAFSSDGINLAFKAAVTTGSPEPDFRVDDLGLVLQRIELGFSGSARPALQVGNAAIAGGSFDAASRSASIARLEVSDGIVDLIRDKRETLNFVRLFETGGHTAGDAAQEEDPVIESKPWSIFLETIALTDFTTHFTDETVQPGMPIVDLENINLSLSRFDGKSPFPFEAALQVNQGGTMTASGTIDPSLAAVESTISAENLALPVIQPYLAQAAQLTLNSGLLSIGGSFNLTEAGGLAYLGRLGITDLEVIENITRDIMLGWAQFRTPELRLEVNPNNLEVETLNIAGLKGELIIADDGRINVVEALKSETETPAEPMPEKTAPDTAEESFPVKIGRVSLDKGMLHFADFSLRPQFDTRIHELKGVINNVSSLPGARTRVGLDGRVDRYGTSKITGEINFFDPKEFTDISMVFDNLEMTNLTPYSGKFAGHKIDSGRLFLDLQYKIENSRLLSQNKVVIDNLVLGDRVESPDAVNLPLRLAIALLRDANGIINIGLPITGSLDDPEFSYGRLVWQTVSNLLSRIVTSPFRALASLLGADDETLNEVLLEPGSGSIPPSEQEKLDTLLEALLQRPKLKLIVTGRYDADADGKVLRDLQVRRAFAEASGIELEPGEDPGPIDFTSTEARDILAELFTERYGAEEYEEILADIIPHEEDDESKDDQEEKIDPGEVARALFEALFERETLAPGVLERLADERAQAVLTHMTGPDGLDPERITTRPSESTGKGEPLSLILDLDTVEEGS